VLVEVDSTKGSRRGQSYRPRVRAESRLSWRHRTNDRTDSPGRRRGIRVLGVTLKPETAAISESGFESTGTNSNCPGSGFRCRSQRGCGWEHRGWLSAVPSGAASRSDSHRPHGKSHPALIADLQARRRAKGRCYGNATESQTVRPFDHSRDLVESMRRRSSVAARPTRFPK
jgi:hypothetical protein